MRPSVSQLQHTVAVAKAGSFSKAARELNVSQPSVSNSVSDLEEMLGKNIFRRSTRSVKLSPFGEALLPTLIDAVSAVDRVFIEANSIINPDKKLLRVAFTPLLDIGRVDSFLSAYRLGNPEVEVVFKECAHESLEERLLSEQIDVAFAHDVPKNRELRRCTLFFDSLHYIPVNGDVEVAQTKVSINHIALNPLLLTNGSCGLAPTTLKMFELEGIEPSLYIGRAMTHSGLKDWAELGLGGAVLPGSKLMPNPNTYPVVEIHGIVQKIEYQAVWAKSSESAFHLGQLFKQIPKIATSVSRESGKL